MFTRLINFIKTLYRNRGMIKAFAFADLKKQYMGSYGGILWSVVNPLSIIITYYIIFSFLFKAKVAADYGTKSYALWLISGILPWLFFSETVKRSTSALLDNQSLVTKTLFPSEIIPVCLLVSGIINHLIGLALLLVFAVVISGGLSVFSAFTVIYFSLMVLMVLGFSWALSSLNAFIRDIGQLVGVVLNLWFFYTPIFYPLSIVPEKYRILIKLNPMFHVVEGYRNSLLVGRYPEPYHLLYLAVFATVAFTLGGLLYKRLKPAFVDVI